MNINVIFRIVAPLAVAAFGVTACTDDQRRSLGEEDVRDSLRASVEQVLDTHDASLDGDLGCTATIGADGTVAGSCTGTTDDGNDVAAAYTGTADVDEETCQADLTVSVAGEQLAADSGANCFDS
jgi:hypothetical protein